MSDYQSRLQAYTSGKDPIAMQQEAPVILATLIGGMSDAKLQTRPGPEKWSVGEILAHLAEDELATAWRYRQMIEHNGCELASFVRPGSVGAARPLRFLESEGSAGTIPIAA